MKTLIAILSIAITLNVNANEKTDTPETEKNANHNAIPPRVSPDDPEVKLTIEEHIRILNAKKADHITKGYKTDGQPSIETRTREKILKEKFDSNPRQTIPLKECIKPNGVIDNEVNECMNGRIKKNW